MIEITSSQVTPLIKSLFDRSDPTWVRCRAVLGSGNAGRIFVDDPELLKMGYVWEREDGHLYQGGEKDWQVVRQIVELLRRQGTVAL